MRRGGERQAETTLARPDSPTARQREDALASLVITPQPAQYLNK